MRYKIIILFLVFTGITCCAQSYKLNNLGISYPAKDSVHLDKMIKYEIDFYRRIADFDSITLNVKIFDKSAAYYLYQKEIAHLYEKTSGFFSPKANQEVVLKKEGIPYLPILYHEISHYFFNKIIPKKPPHWLNEGLAEYFAHVQISKNAIKHEMTEYERGRIKTMIEISDLNLHTFFTWGPSEFMKKEFTDDSYTYILSHGIVYFLIKKDSEQFKQLVLKIKNGSSSQEVIDAIYKGGFKQFEADFISYYTNI